MTISAMAPDHSTFRHVLSATLLDIPDILLPSWMSWYTYKRPIHRKWLQRGQNFGITSARLEKNENFTDVNFGQFYGDYFSQKNVYLEETTSVTTDGNLRMNLHIRRRSGSGLFSMFSDLLSVGHDHGQRHQEASPKRMRSSGQMKYKWSKDPLDSPSPWDWQLIERIFKKQLTFTSFWFMMRFFQKLLFSIFLTQCSRE